MSQQSENFDNRSLLKSAYLEIRKIHAELNAIKQAKAEPIAIIGLGCRFPGAKNPQAFWQLLRNGVDAITEVPPNRWDVDAFYDPDPNAVGKMNTRWGGFLEQVDQFDAQFFGISPREAKRMDPQQRLLLEVTYEALENAGVAPNSLAGSRTGVFIGIGTNDYIRFQTSDLTKIDAYAGTGNARSIVANRLSYLLDLRGPSLAVDTACSSSLVTIHLACRSLRCEESDVSLVGGVNLILTPDMTINFSQARMMAADGRCKTFDADADGYVRGEGCGVVVLKRCSDALKDGDHILALIKGSAVNQDGRSNGLTAPNGPSQEAVIRQAMAEASLTPDQISYVEAHGTGTPLGDPIEMGSLSAVLGDGRSSEQPFFVGSVKTNIGHLEAAAGIAGLIKVVLALQHDEIPPHLNFKKPNPHLPWDKTPVVIPNKPTPWPAAKGQRIAGVSSFGFGGTNAHVILEEAPAVEFGSPEAEHPTHLLTLSAKSEAALLDLASQYQHHLATNPSLALPDVCFTANSGRAHFNHRLAIVADTSDQMRARLVDYTNGRQSTGVLIGPAQANHQPKVAFLFSGQGSQYIGMGRQLFQTQPTFRETLQRCDQLLRPYLQHPLLSVLFPRDDAPSPLDETAFTQPALFAIEYALAELWRSWGVEPAVVMGHSVGEYVAACLAGVFSLEDGLKLVAERGRLMQTLPQDGMMAAVFTDQARVAAAIEPYGKQASIAAINGPKNTVISGAKDAIQTLVEKLKAEGIVSQLLTVSHAFHSPLMEPILDSFEQKASQLRFKTPRIPLVSNLTGRRLEANGIPDAGYWRRHIREAVEFAEGINTLVEQNCELFLEVGPNSTLLRLGKRCLESEELIWLPSLNQGRDEWQLLMNSLAKLYVQGVKINWSGFFQGYLRRRVPLPTYPFERQRYWIEPSRLRDHQSTTSVESLHMPKKTRAIPIEKTFPEAGNSTQIINRVSSADIVALLREQTAVILAQNEILKQQAALLATSTPVDRVGEKLEDVSATPLSQPVAGKPMRPKEIPRAYRTQAVGTDDRMTADGADLVKKKILDLVSEISAFPKDLLRLEQELIGELGFDSLMLAELNRGITAVLPKVGDIPQTILQKMFANDFTVGDLVDFVLDALSNDPGANVASEQLSAAYMGAQQTINRYVPTLREQPCSNIVNLFGVPGTLLVVADRLGVAEKVSARLSATGQRVVNVDLWAPFTGIQMTGDNRYALGWESEDFDDLINTVKNDVGPVGGILYIAGLGTKVDLDDTDVSAWRAATYAAFRIARSVAKGGPLHAFISVTGMGGSFGLDGKWEPHTHQGGIVGLTKALAREWPQVFVKAIDLSPASSPDDQADAVFTELGVSDRSVEVGIDHNGVRRVVVLDEQPFGEYPIEFEENSVVVIAGGGKGIGAVIGIELATRFRPKLIILGRSEPPLVGDASELLANLTSMREAGAQVTYMQWDVRDRQSAVAVFDAIREAHGPIHTVIHSAGVLADAEITSKEDIDFIRVFDTKIAGAIHLYHATIDDPLRLFILFSSWTGRFGNAGQTDYAAANEVLNKLAHAIAVRRPQSKVIAMGWPLWQKSGMGLSLPDTVRHAMKARGVTLLSEAEGLDIFIHELATSGIGEVIYGRSLPVYRGASRIQEQLSVETHPYLDDHRLRDTPVLPFAVAMNYAARCVAERGSTQFTLADFKLYQGVEVKDKTYVTVDGHYDERPDAQPLVTVEIRAGSDRFSPGVLAYRCKAFTDAVPHDSKLELSIPQNDGKMPALRPDAFYRDHTFHGPMLQGILSIDEFSQLHVSGTVRTSRPQEWISVRGQDAWSVDPLVLDGSFQMAAYWAYVTHGRSGFPLEFREYCQVAPFGDGPVRCIVSIIGMDGDLFTGNIIYQNDSGQTLAILTGIQARAELVQSEPEKADATLAKAVQDEIPPEYYRFDLFSEFIDLKRRLEMLQRNDIHNPYFNVREGVGSDHSRPDNIEMISYLGYNYLNMANDPVVCQAAKDAIDLYGTSVSASRISSGERSLHQELDRAVADLVGTEDAMVFVNAHMANMAATGHLLGTDDLILHDKFVHISIINGSRMSGARRRPFPHNNWQALDRMLVAMRPNYKRVLIVIDGVYSMDGDIPDLPRFIEVKKRHKAFLMIDEAHSIGVLGEHGRGIGEYYDVDPNDVDLWIGSLSKAFASVGGYIASSESLIEYLKYTAPGFVNTTGISPPNAAAALAAIRLLQAEPERVRYIHNLAKLFLQLARERGLNTGLSQNSTIIPIIVGDEKLCLQLSQALFDRKIDVKPILPPMVDKNDARLRFFMTTRHTEEQIYITVNAIAEELARISAE